MNIVLVVSHYYEAEADYVLTMAHSKQFFLSRSNVLAVVILCMYSSYYSCIIILTSVGALCGYCLDQVTESMLVMLVSLTTMPTPNGRYVCDSLCCIFEVVTIFSILNGSTHKLQI